MTASRPLTRSPRRLALVATVATLSLGGCAGTGVTAQTNAQYQPGIGANVRTGPIQLFNALAVDNGDETATLSVSILNEDEAPAKLVSASVRPSTGTATGWAAKTEAAIIGVGDLVDIGKAGSVVLSGKGLEAGGYVDVTLTFDRGRKVSVEAPVVARNTIYDQVPNSTGEEVPAETPAAEADAGAGAEAPAAH